MFQNRYVLLAAHSKPEFYADIDDALEQARVLGSAIPTQLIDQQTGQTVFQSEEN